MATTPNKPTKTRAYKFRNRTDGHVRFIRAPNKMLAMQQVARKDWEATVATQDDLEEHLPLGVRIERYEPEPVAREEDEDTDAAPETSAG